MLKTVSYTARERGPHLLILGAVHGNETCGTVAINRVLAAFDAGEIVLARGKVTFIPVCNPRAHARNVRYTERNLNRYLIPMDRPNSYEAELGNILCPILADCDVLLDIHSYTVGGAPFTLVSAPTEDALRYAAALGDYSIVTNWADAYANSGRKQTEEDVNEGTGTVEYAARHGVLGLTLECGQHTDPVAIEVAEAAIYNGLRYHGLVDSCDEVVCAEPKIVAMQRVYYRGEGGELTKAWKNLEPLAKGDVIARDGSGQDICAPDDGYIVMPKMQAKPGEEWFYFATNSALRVSKLARETKQQ